MELMNAEKKWFFSSSYKKLNKSLCPRCANQYPFGPLFDHHKRECPHCGAHLVEWAIRERLILIDVDFAPPFIRQIIEWLDNLSEPDADKEVQRLADLFKDYSQL